MQSDPAADKASRQAAHALCEQVKAHDGVAFDIAGKLFNQGEHNTARHFGLGLYEHLITNRWLFLSLESKAQMKEVVMQLVSQWPVDDSAAAFLKHKAVQVVALTAKREWPHQWPTLTTVLIGAVREGRSEASVLGALRCLAMICRDLDEAQVPLVVPSLLPELHSLVAPDSVSRAVKRRALAVLHSCLLALGMMSGARQRATRDLLAPELPRFLDAFATVLSEVPDAADPDACGTTLETLRCVTQVAQYFAKPAGEALMRPLGCAASLFHRLAERYRALFVAHGADPDARVEYLAAGPA